VDEQTVAAAVAAQLAGSYNKTGGRLVVPLTEGSEPAEFWAGLGGQGTYPTHHSEEEGPARNARLFCASTNTGSFKVEEVCFYYAVSIVTLFHSFDDMVIVGG